MLRNKRAGLRLALCAAVIVCLVVLCVGAGAPASPARKPPKLVLLLVVDQFRGDYLSRYRNEYTGGFARLLKNGAVLTNAYVQEFPTVTGLVHATFLSGTPPSQTGIVGDDWYDRESGRLVGSVFDPAVKILGAAGSGASPRFLMASTVGDELKMADNDASRVIGVSLKGYAAILSAGRMADGAYWFDQASGNIVSSTFYFPALPAWVTDFNKNRLVDRWTGAGWAAWSGKYLRTLPASPGPQYYASLAASPFGNELLLSFAERVIESESLGSHNGTDLLCISLSSTDWVGHTYGPDSEEIHDMIVRTDRQLGQFFQFLDKRFGANSVLLVFTADHGVAPLPETQAKRRLPGGRVSQDDLQKVVLAALNAKYGEGRWVLYSAYGTFWLNDVLIRQRKLDEAAVQDCAAKALAGTPHVYRAYTRTQVLRGEAGQDPVGRRVARSFFPARSGDVIATLEPYWIFAATGTTHGSAYDYDSHVPLVFMGPGIRSGTYKQTVGVNDIAPTLASILQIESPGNSSGRVLREIVRPR